MRANQMMIEPSNWGQGIKFISASWFAWFFNIWLEGGIGAGLLLAAALAAVYWTLGSTLEEFAYNNAELIRAQRSGR